MECSFWWREEEGCAGEVDKLRFVDGKFHYFCQHHFKWAVGLVMLFDFGVRWETACDMTKEECIKTARRMQREIYKKSAAVEKKWGSKLGAFSKITDQSAAKLAKKMCKVLGYNPPKVVGNSNKIEGGAAGHYDPNSLEIHLKDECFDTTSFIHELSHHIIELEGRKLKIDLDDNHGPLFVETEKVLFSTLYEMIRKKNEVQG